MCNKDKGNKITPSTIMKEVMIHCGPSTWFGNQKTELESTHLQMYPALHLERRKEEASIRALMWDWRWREVQRARQRNRGNE